MAVERVLFQLIFALEAVGQGIGHIGIRLIKAAVQQFLKK